VLANSITLTPGTVTLDVDGDDYVIHALTRASAASLGTSDSPGPMVRRIAAIFARPGRGEA
jgi:multicomponent Na+:H+ antiporter subunit E